MRLLPLRVTTRLLFLLSVIFLFHVTHGSPTVRKPSIILVPGTFHRPTIYNQVVGLLRSANYQRNFPIVLPSVGARASREKDVAAVRTVFLGELQRGQDVVLVGSSYGGTVIGEAVKGLTSMQRESVLGLVYFAGFIPLIQDVEFPELKPSLRDIAPSFFRFSDADGKVYFDGDPAIPPRISFYNDLSDAAAAYWTSQLLPSSLEATEANATYIPYTGDYRCVFVVCEQDNALPASTSDLYLNQPEAQFEVESLNAGHVPMLSRPREVARIIRRVAGEQLG
ncbi:alpha/beta-hydrolase [Sporormia fimetaria CBS 119925]|uniref:Alpha/beta-hydrolase n=1 Tax=Sporormia fimetaria CBS 119925 TaxID=1340428 RepID=A0A6A6V264_9PLEO|nr:alpha/beta-hydrolase [Sporormia fimetaria CBS 119925]